MESDRLGFKSPLVSCGLRASYRTLNLSFLIITLGTIIPD